MKFVPYLSFAGNAEEAMKFYKEALGGHITGIMRYSEMEPAEGMPPTPEDYMDKVLHGTLDVNGELLYFSDTFPGMEAIKGNTVEINIMCDSEEDLTRKFNLLALNGTINMPVDKMFWGAVFGSLTDQYGIGWSLNYSLPQE